MIKLGQDHFGAELYAETDSDGFWVKIERPDGPCLSICVNERSDLEALAELAAEALATLPE